jgi:hypothetical protein
MDIKLKQVVYFAFVLEKLEIAERALNAWKKHSFQFYDHLLAEVPGVARDQM